MKRRGFLGTLLAAIVTRKLPALTPRPDVWSNHYPVKHVSMKITKQVVDAVTPNRRAYLDGVERRMALELRRHDTETRIIMGAP